MSKSIIIPGNIINSDLDAVETVGKTRDFHTVPSVDQVLSKHIAGYGLTTAHIFYLMPDHQSIVQEFIWQEYDQFPTFPVLGKFLAFWEKNIEGPINSVLVTHSRLFKPAEIHHLDGELILQ